MKIETQITDDKIKGLLCAAFEGGSNYWYEIEKYSFGDSGLTYSDFRKGGIMQCPDNYWHPCQLVPLTDKCAVLINDLEGGKQHRLDRRAIERGLEVMAEKYLRHWGDFVSDNDDADTGDVFLQCCLFGEVIYG